MKSTSLTLLLLFGFYFLHAQGLDHEYDLVEFQTNETGKHFIGITGMELSPDGESVAISMEQSGPIVIWDWKNKTIIQ